MTIQQQINDHIADQNDPHNITPAKIGLGNINNYPIATIGEAEEGTRDDRYLTPLRLKSVFDGYLKRSGLMDSAGNPIIPDIT